MSYIQFIVQTERPDTDRDNTWRATAPTRRATSASTAVKAQASTRRPRTPSASFCAST
jgi:hypothetical protein